MEYTLQDLIDVMIAPSLLPLYYIVHFTINEICVWKTWLTFIGAAISPDVDKVSVEAVENDALPETLTIRFCIS